MGDANTDYSKYIIPATVAVIGFSLYNKFFGSGSGSGSNNQATDSTTATSLAQSLADAKRKYPQTLTDAQCSAAANTIYTLGLSGSYPLSDAVQTQIVYQVIAANTLTDLLTIMSYFGTRKVNAGSWYSLCALADINCDSIEMQSFLNSVLQSYYLNEINVYLSGTGINYTF